MGLRKIKNHDKSLLERYSLFPITDTTPFEYYQYQEAAHWPNSEMDFPADVPYFEGLPKPLKRGIIYIFSQFAKLDNTVAENGIYRFMLESTSYEEMAFYGKQVANELTHIETYNTTIQQLISDPTLRDWIFHATDHIPSVRNMTIYCEKYVDSDRPREERMLAFACAEGIFFIAAFSFFYWLRKNQEMYPLRNLVYSNIQIAKDESLHRDYAIKRIKELTKKGVFKRLPIEVVREIIQTAVEMQREFIFDAFPEGFGGYDPKNVHSDAMFLANRISEDLGYGLMYPEVTELANAEFGTFIAPLLNNFYENRTGQYGMDSDPKTFVTKMLMLGKGKDEEESEEASDTESSSEDTEEDVGV